MGTPPGWVARIRNFGHHIHEALCRTHQQSHCALNEPSRVREDAHPVAAEQTAFLPRLTEFQGPALIVTHDRRLIRQLARKLWTLHEGQLNVADRVLA
jgi:hypothetical protein